MKIMSNFWIASQCTFQITLKMRLTVLLAIVSILQIHANSYSQSKIISLEFGNVTIKDVLNEIESMSDFKFLFNRKDVDLDRKVSIKVNKKRVGDILAELLPDVGYEVLEKQIVLKKIIKENVPKSNLKEVFTNMNKQQFTVTGIIMDEKEIPLSGANVIEKGTTNGVTADLDGNFSINMSNGNSVLVISYVGFETKEVPVNGQTNIVVVLVESASALDEVVLVGYGTQRRKDVTGSVASVQTSAIEDIAMKDISQGLVGQIPGLDVISTGIGLDGASQIRLRGQRSFTASNDPLIILDGSPYYGTLNDINPYDIKSVDVLKDASSTAIYGARGANGVIIISTKRGTNSRPKITFDGYSGPVMVYGRLPYALGEDYAEIAREAYRAIGAYPDSGTNAEYDAQIFDAIELEAIAKGGDGLDYQDMVFRTGLQQKYQLGLSGGTETVRYNVSGNYFDQKGIVLGESFKRYSIRTNLDFTLSRVIKAGVSVLLSHSKNSRKSNSDFGNNGGALAQVFRSSPLGKLYEDDGTPRFSATQDGLVLNPMADFIWDSYRWDNKRWTGLINAFTEVKILPELTYRLNVGSNFKLITTKESAGFYSLLRNLGAPTASVADKLSSLGLLENIVTYDKTFGEDHRLTLTAIQGVQTEKTVTTGAAVSDLPYETSRYHNLGSASQVTSVGSDLLETGLLSYAGRIFYGLKDKYLLTLSLRADGASQFSTDNKWGYFPSAAFAYRISEESFMKETNNWLSELKLRLSYGETGNQAIQPYQTQGGLSRTAYSWNNSPAFGYRPIELKNNDLKWETTSVFNFGLDFELFKSRIRGTLDIYKTTTTDLLMYRNLPITTGYEQVLQNVGSTINNGFEIGLSSTNVINDNFSWNTDITYSSNRTKIDQLYNGKVDDVGNQWFIGQPIQVYYDFKKIGIWQSNEEDEARSFGMKPGQIKVLDVNGDGAITDDDRVILGSPQPDFVGNITNRFTYKNWDLSFQVYVRWGGMTSVDAFEPYSKKRYNKMVFDYWTPTNPTNEYPRPDQLYEGGGLYSSTLAYRDASQINLRQFSLGYSFPKKILDDLGIISNLRIYLSAENLAYWTKSELRKFNMKADFPDNVTAYPEVRTFITGINLSF